MYKLISADTVYTFNNELNAAINEGYRISDRADAFKVTQSSSDNHTECTYTILLVK